MKKVILIGIISLHYLIAFGQEWSEICDSPEIIGDGGTELTLCEQNSGILNWTHWNGTTNTSSIGNQITGVNLWIHGDVVVDQSFSFNNCVVRLDPGVEITVTTFKVLQTDDSQFYCCEDFWKGIDLHHFAKIYTRNGTQFEDAEMTIHSIDQGLSGVSCDQTTFNRNIEAIHLEDHSPWLQGIPTFNGPMIRFMNRTNFTCTSPMNNGDISYVGMHLINTPWIGLYGTNNTFRDLKNGIISPGQRLNVLLLPKETRFHEILGDGIFANHTILTAENCHFRNCQNNGIHIEDTRRLSLKNCRVRIDNVVDVLGTTNGIHVQNIDVGGKVDIQDNVFYGNIQSGQSARIIYLSGGDIQPGATTTIHSNDFELSTGKGDLLLGTVQEGIWGPQTTTQIFNNDFSLKHSTGYVCRQGDKNNLGFYGNEFFSLSPGLQNAVYAEFSNSSGINNVINDNESYSISSNPEFPQGFTFNDFDYSTICSNTFRSARAGSFYFSGDNTKTDFVWNVTIGHNLITIASGSTIDDQLDKGNRWFSPPGLAPTWSPEALCQGDPSLSRFRVHEVQSESTNPITGLHWTPFHPFDIRPDNQDEWWYYEAGTQPVSSTCSSQAPAPSQSELTLLDSVTINGQLINYQGMSFERLWQKRRSLYLYVNKILDPTDSFLFDDLIDSLYNTDIEDLYFVRQYLNDSITNSSIESTITGSDSSMEAYIVELGNIDSTAMSAINDISGATSIFDSLTQMLLYEAGFIDSVNIDFELNRVNDINYILTENTQVTPSNISASNEKSFYNIYFNYLKSDTLTSTQIIQLEQMADQCVYDGGDAVYNSRGLLPYCLRKPDLWTISDSLCLDSLVQTSGSSALKSEDRIVRSNLENRSTMIMHDRIGYDCPDGDCTVILTDMAGKIVYQKRHLNKGIYWINRSDVSQSGVYILNVSFSNNRIYNQKIIVADHK